MTLDSNIVKGNNYTVFYSPGSIHSYDGGQLTAFENLSAYNILNDYAYVHNIPNKIEAEEFINRQGFNMSGCTDVGGGDCLTNIKNGNWADYYADVSQPGKYTLGYRISSMADTGQIQLIANGKVVSTLNLPTTGSWSNWQTVSTTAELSEGFQIIRMYVLHGGFHLNWMQFSTGTGVEEQTSVPRNFQLFQNYPNPFNPSTNISFSLPSKSFVSLKVFDLLGREVATIVSEILQAGNYSRQWDASAISSGVYFYQLRSGNLIETKKLVLIK